MREHGSRRSMHCAHLRKAMHPNPAATSVFTASRLCVAVTVCVFTFGFVACMTGGSKKDDALFAPIRASAITWS